MNAAPFGVLQSFALAGADEVALELGNTAEEGDKQAPVRRVVFARASARERKPEPFSAICASVFGGPGIERDSLA